ncbi:hypothetical protein EC957_001885 [Mortierella hygrophila]|uniref:PWI domain-containing protein n=1 Tax=Mortierella hygrophila TaxID=979708 RepID=A0A9P6F535_9FUNG|nr:hypothetical protein EC957_001885 [Mortierella hygrophila]
MALLQDSSSSSSSTTEDHLHHTTIKDEALLKRAPSTDNTTNTNTPLHPTICNSNKVRHHHNFRDEEAPEVHLPLHSLDHHQVNNLTTHLLAHHISSQEAHHPLGPCHPTASHHLKGDLLCHHLELDTLELHHRMPPPSRPGFGPGPPPPSLPGSVGMVGPYGGVVPPMSVPGMPGMKPGGGIPPVGLGNNALLTGPPSSLGAGTGVGQGGAMAAVGGALPDKMNTLFIGSIAPGINKVAMEKLLRTTGNLVKWKHVQDPTTQKWKAFGFAEYADADSLLRTLRVLGQDGQQPKGEKPVGLELKAMDGSDVVKALLVKADEKTRQFLDQYEESRPRTIHDTEKDKVALANATKIIQQMKDGILDTTDTTAKSDDTAAESASSSSNKDKEDLTLVGRPRRHNNLDGTGKMGEDGNEEEMSEEQKELIAREINFFRERAALKEKERKEEEERSERMARSGHHHRQSKDSGSAATGANASSASASHRAGRDRAWGGSSSSGGGAGGSRQMDFVAASGTSHTDVGSSPALASTSSAGAASSASQGQDTGMDSEEEEKARQERRDRETEHTFKERERRWEQREVERMRLYEKDKARDADYQAESYAARDVMAARFAQWNDDVERERRHEDYYRDRSRWWHRRQAFLQKEQRYDDLDREEEKEKQAEAAKKAAQEVEAAAAAVANAAAEAGAAMEVDSAAIATPSASQDKDVEMNEAYGSGSISSTAEEAEKNDASGLTIPSDPQELWNWPVQWLVMEANDGLILKEKIMPFTTKIVVELLGVPEEDLTKYVVDHIRQRKPPQDLISELRGALDNDADKLVARVWKLLIEETESAARKQ